MKYFQKSSRPGALGRRFVAILCALWLVGDVGWWVASRGVVPGFYLLELNPHMQFSYYFRVDREPPLLVAQDDPAVELRLRTDASVRREDIVMVHVSISGNLHGGLWGRTRRSRAAALVFSDFSGKDRLDSDEGSRILGSVRAQTMAYIRANEPQWIPLIPIHLVDAPFNDVGFRASAHDTVVHWPGYVHNAISAGALGGLVWSVWPRRKRGAGAPTTRAPDDGPRPAG
jgi:hypothetical protein